MHSIILEIIDIKCTIAPDLPLVLADSDQIHRASSICCTSAWRAMDDSDGRIEIVPKRVEVTAELCGTEVVRMMGPFFL
ncbi:MAG: hypothetical protein M2R45_03002 [Verrucomicrobia subdivision 3 bacterium]|nr:hypothetical protein [Limisphaerales bacterium]MCS1416512.1 hypothetical protein [Limisphaerales bacterium]